MVVFLIKKRLFNENVYLSAKNGHFRSKIVIFKIVRFFGLNFLSFPKRLWKIRTEKFKKSFFFRENDNFHRIWCIWICKINDPILQNAFYSRIFVIISWLFAYNWTKCRNLRFLLEIVSHKIVMCQKCDNLRYLNGTFFLMIPSNT